MIISSCKESKWCSHLRNSCFECRMCCAAPDQSPMTKETRAERSGQAKDPRVKFMSQQCRSVVSTLLITCQAG